jgi:hypothetical protein
MNGRQSYNNQSHPTIQKIKHVTRSPYTSSKKKETILSLSKKQKIQNKIKKEDEEDTETDTESLWEERDSIDTDLLKVQVAEDLQNTKEEIKEIEDARNKFKLKSPKKIAPSKLSTVKKKI